MRRTIRGTHKPVEQAARTMRREPTRAEEVLWGALRRNQVAGLKFRRQHPVGRFVLDFYCASCKLAVEVDGDVHDEQTERDAERTKVLERYGYRVLRRTADFRPGEAFRLRVVDGTVEARVEGVGETDGTGTP